MVVIRGALVSAGVRSMNRISIVLDIAAAICGCVWTTTVICDPKPNPSVWNTIGWTFSLIAVGRVLCTTFKRPDSNPNRRGASISFAAVAVFCFTMLTLTGIRFLTNQQPLPMDDFAHIATLGMLGLTCAFFSIRLS
jgi:hypothetical protein